MIKMGVMLEGGLTSLMSARSLVIGDGFFHFTRRWNTLTLNSLPNFRSSSMWDLCWTDGAGGREKSFENFKQQHKGCVTRQKAHFQRLASTKLKYLYSSCFPLLCSGSRRSVPLQLHRGSHSLWKRHNNPVSCRISNSKLMHTVKSLVL